MDRNIIANGSKIYKLVALRKESVDRNLFVHAHIVCMPVALRKESVDRNYAECLRL